MRLDAAPAGRIDLLDLARGVAIVAMVVYHFSWDLEFFGLVSWPVNAGIGWRVFAALIAGSFLAVAGASLVLAHGEGTRWRGFAKRFATIVAAAAAVSLATWLALPGSGVYFGILHAIAAASLLALPFARAPAIALFALAALFVALPHVVASSRFDHPAWLWLGLGAAPPIPTADYEPLFPWAGCTFLGMGLARVALAARDRSDWSRLRAVSRPARALAWSGRQSLWIYLAHQPALLALIGLAALAMDQPRMQSVDAGFLASCEANCAAHGADAESCRAICACTAEALRAEGLWEQTVRERLSQAERRAVDGIVGRCSADSGL